MLELTKAGASDLKGFIEAPETGPAKNASSRITPPTSMLVSKRPFLNLDVATKIVSSKKEVKTSSRMNDSVSVPEGSVEPNKGSDGKQYFKIRLAESAPEN